MDVNEGKENTQKNQWTAPKIIDLDISKNTAGGPNNQTEGLDSFVPTS